MQTIWSCTWDSWQIGIGDPGWGGWMIVAIYISAGLLSLRVAVGAVFPEASRGRERAFWGILGLVLLLLAVNKQLDLQTLLTDTARCMAQLQGWYETRRPVQIGFLLAVFVSILILFAAASISLRGTMRRNGLALTGLVFVLGFVGMRAAGFHHMDRLINMEFHAVRVNWILEMTGPLLILLGGVLILRKS
jgi:hypothetical protein